MRINLNREQMTNLYQMISFLLKEFPANDKEEMMVDLLVEKIRIKLRNRLDAYLVKDSYCVHINVDEALAFDTWMAQIRPLLKIDQFVFEKTIALKITNKIDLTYGTIKRTGQTA